jgi:rod shape determining protein RodA
MGVIGFFVFLQIDFDILAIFSNHLYIISIFLLILPLVIGQVTRGAIRWIPIGPLTIQPSEIVRPFLLLFFANYLTKKEFNPKRAIFLIVLVLLPLLLILIQPSLGVAALTFVGFFGVLLASPVRKKYFLAGVLLFILLIPILWTVLAPYQKERIVSFLDPYSDPQGVGYNSIQSMISVGSGRLFGRGLGEGIQTQLAFLPEKHTDFIFAATAEELGFVGAIFLLLGLFIIFNRLIKTVENPVNPTSRAYASGLFLVLFLEATIHIGMNMGLLPITGVPLPLVSAGGSSYLATMVGLAISINARKKNGT